MLLERLVVRGLRHDVALDDLEARVVAPVGPAGVALADGVDLLAAALDPARVPNTLQRLGVADAGSVEVLDEGGLPVQASWSGSEGADALLGDALRIVVECDLTLDPLLFGLLRDHAVRDARLATGLGDARLSLTCGWLFTKDRTAVAISINKLMVGQTAFPVTGTERPAWLSALASALASRFQRCEYDTPMQAIAVQLHDASVSASPQVRSGFAELVAAMDDVPFGLGRLELVRGLSGIEARFGDRLTPARAFGPAGGAALRLAHAVYVPRPDILVVEAPAAGLGNEEAVSDWLLAQTSGENAALEQVIIVPGGGA